MGISLSYAGASVPWGVVACSTSRDRWSVRLSLTDLMRWLYHLIMFIPHPHALEQGVFLARYDRFIARVNLNGQEVDAHCVNTGRMEGLIKPGSVAWLSRAPEGSQRKLRYTLELLEVDGITIGANTQTPNRLAEALVQARLIPGLRRYSTLKREVRYAERSRIDLLLQQGGRRHFVEVKNCHLVYPDGGAYFPDSVSERATEHLQALARQVREGHRATVLFIVQRNDARAVRPSDLHDPAFAKAARDAAEAGVRFRAAAFNPTAAGFGYLGLLPVQLRQRNIARLQAYAEPLRAFSGWQRRGKRQAS